MLSLQVYSHPDGVLVTPGWFCHFLLLPQTRDSPSQRPVHREAQEQSEAHTFT